MSLAQCNVMISLVDDWFYERAWCALEVNMMQTLRISYKQHQWYEQLSLEEAPSSEKKQWVLREGLAVMEIQPSQKKLSIESDRAAIQFLEGQQSLLGCL